MSSASNAAIRVSRQSSEFVGHQECWGRCSLCVTVQRPAAWLRWMRALAGLVFCLAFMAQQAGPASAVENELMTGISSPGENSATPAPVAPDFEGIQEECRLRIKSLRDEMLVARANQKVVRPQATKELELWGSLEIIVEEWRLAYEDRLRHESGQPINSGSVAQAHQPPGSFLEVDELRARRVAVISSLKSLHLEVASEQRIANGLSDDFDSVEQEKRKTAEALSSSGVERRFALQQQLVVQALESRVLKANLDLHNERIHLLQTHAKDAATEVETLDALVNAPSSHFKLSKQELDERVTILDKFEQQVRMQLSALDTQMREIMMRRHAGKNISESNYEIVREESQLLRDLLSNTSLFKECWRRRYELSNFDVPPSEIEEWLEDGEQLSQQVAQIDEKLRLRTRQRRESLSLLTRAAGTVSGVTGGSVSLTGAQPDADTLARIEELENVLEFYGGIQVLATSGGRLCSLFLEDLRVEQDAYSFADNAGLFWGWVLAAWEFEITESEGKAITVKKVVIGLALLLFGYLLSRALASLVAYRVLPRFGVSHAAASVLRSVMLYAMIVALFFVSLDVVNVPLTFFAFFGGAAAIGLGFGSQNLLNNFISGLILLVERPIRVGDLVNVDGIDANVEHIGARSTRVRTGSNLEILVPNSKFLENNVTNWTLSDTRIRTSVSVGVA
ncbi:MAG: mechanosensitive ion channel domain-containing protein, partial [Rubripirellula sp.]